eukprot:CAMPEP_0205808100 /NCGR_PEP_ID=MMETSP0205-20121125/11970_1 /ASSEMBLY_ACC=CAM_ASM_000278 /TAXON_ID=36767 /ORGANISM="Euplotes focardii, Strain TN1" /LENGTH=124 /DNA_ID=CAMNT_0053083273 /DNA_START=452 /DNA_END=826 /DNA_ORIENTATION=-
MGNSNKNVTIKVAIEPVTVKTQKEETFRAVEDSEKISTAISSSEKSQNKVTEMRYDQENELVHNEYNKEFHYPLKADVEETSKEKNCDLDDHLYHNESLLDQICEKQAEEFCDDEFMKDSLSHY